MSATNANRVKWVNRLIEAGAADGVVALVLVGPFVFEVLPSSPPFLS